LEPVLLRLQIRPVGVVTHPVSLLGNPAVGYKISSGGERRPIMRTL